MNLGTILDGFRSSPAVVHPVKFRVGGQNAQAQKTAGEARAVLVYVDEEERADLLVAAAKHLATRYPGAPIPLEVQQSEETLRFLAVALRDPADPAKPFCDGGPDQLRLAVPAAVLGDLFTEYVRFREREYPVQLTPKHEKQLQEQAAGK